MNFLKSLQILPLFIASILLASIGLPQMNDEGGRLGIASLIIFFIISVGLSVLAQAFQELKSGKKISEIWKNLKITQIDLAVWSLILAALVATFASYFFRESLSGLLKYALYFFLYCAFCFAIKDRQAVYLMLLSALIGSIWINAEGIKQVIFGAAQLATWEDPNVHVSQQLNRVYSTLLNPNLLAAYLLALWSFGLVGMGFWGKGKIFQKIVLPVLGLALSGLMLYLILQTGSRGAWLALIGQFAIIGLALIVFTRSPLILGGFVISALGAVFYLVSKPAFWNRLLSIFDSYNHSSNSFRLHVWQACLQLIAENPIFGIGPGSKAFYLAYGIYMESKYSALGAYSLFMEIPVEMGLIGFAALLFLVYAIARAGITGIKKFQMEKVFSREDQQKRFDLLIFLAVLCGLMGLLLNGLFDIVILRPQIQIVLWLLVAILRFYSLEYIQNEGKHVSNN